MRREDWDKRYASVENLWATKPNRFLVSEVADLTPGSALDLACGEGQNAIWLATLGWEVTGVDYSEVAIAKAKARAERDGVRANFVCADLVSYEPEAAAFDLVLVLYLHIPTAERRGVLESAAAALAPAARSSSSGTTRPTSPTVWADRAIRRSSTRPTTSRTSSPASRSRRPSASCETSAARSATR